MKTLFLTLACSLVVSDTILLNSSIPTQALPASFPISQTTPNTPPFWYAITSKQGSFELQTPALPQSFTEEHTLVSDNPHGQSRTAQWRMAEVLINTKEPNQKGEYYLVGYTDLTADQVQNLSKAEIFDAEAKYIFNGLFQQGEIPQYKGSEDVTKDGIQGKYYLAEAFNKSLVLVYYLVDRRLYMNFVISDNSAHIKRFLDSFYILESISPVTPQLY